MFLVTKRWLGKKTKTDCRPVSKSRLRQGDSDSGSAYRAALAKRSRFFLPKGVCYTATRAIDIPASTGFGEPIQKLFKFKDGERIIAAIVDGSRAWSARLPRIPKHPDYCAEVHGFAASSNGFALRFCLSPFAEPSTRSGRRYARVGAGASIVDVVTVTGDETILAVSHHCRAIVCSSDDVNYLSGPGKGVTLIRLAKDDELIGFKASSGDRDLLTVETNRGAKKTVSTAKYRVTSRGGRGIEIQKNGKIAKILTPPPEAPAPFDDE